MNVVLKNTSVGINTGQDWVLHARVTLSYIYISFILMNTEMDSNGEIGIAQDNAIRTINDQNRNLGRSKKLCNPLPRLKKKLVIKEFEESYIFLCLRYTLEGYKVSMF